MKKLEKSLTENNSGEASSSLTNVLDVDIRAQDDIAGMSNVRRRIVDALTEERVRSDQECFFILSKQYVSV